MDTNNSKSAQDIAREAWEACSKAQQRWITHVYKARKEELDGRCGERETKAALDGQIPRDFDTRALPRTLIVNIGQILTPYGVLAVNPDSSIVGDLNTVAEAVRDRLVANPSNTGIPISKIVEDVPYNNATVFLLLSDLKATNLIETVSPSRRNKEAKVDCIFKAFYAFEGNIESYLAEAFLPDKQEEAPEPTPREHPFVIRPVFQSRIAHVVEKLCFVMMPFSTKWSSEVYADIFKPALEDAGYTCMRADESGGQIIAEDIWQRISQAGLILADLTGQNKNVMYELGIAHTVGKPIVLLSQQEGNDFPKPPFDIGHHRVHVYEDGASGARKLESELPDIVEDVVQEHKRRASHEIPLSNPPQAYTAFRRGSGFSPSGSVLGRR